MSLRKLTSPETLVLDSFRVEELLVNPNSKLITVSVSTGTIGMDGNYTPVKLLGNFNVEPSSYTDLEDEVQNLVNKLSDRFDTALNSTTENPPTLEVVSADLEVVPTLEVVSDSVGEDFLN